MSAMPNTRLERTRRKRASLLSCVGEPLKLGVIPLTVLWVQVTQVLYCTKGFVLLFGGFA